LPGPLHEACRTFEEQVAVFRHFLITHPESLEASPNDPMGDGIWRFPAWLAKHGLTDSSRRIKDSDKEDTWEGVPQVSVYLLKDI